MYCKNCGKEISENAYVCPACGALADVQKKESNTKALLGFVFSFFFPLVGLILSILGYTDANKYGGDRKGMAKAGIIISSVFIVVNLIISMAYGSWIVSLFSTIY